MGFALGYNFMSYNLEGENVRVKSGTLLGGGGPKNNKEVGRDLWGDFFFIFLGPRQRHMEVPRLGAESELQPLAYTTATATQDPSCIFDLHHSSRQRQILNPLIKARDRPCVFMDASQIRFR